jgi:hypothetical protein
MQRILILNLLNKHDEIRYKYCLNFKLCVIQRQVPLSLPCVNFAQVTIPSLTH